MANNWCGTLDTMDTAVLFVMHVLIVGKTVHMVEILTEKVYIVV